MFVICIKIIIIFANVTVSFFTVTSKLKQARIMIWRETPMIYSGFFILNIMELEIKYKNEFHIMIIDDNDYYLIKNKKLHIMVDKKNQRKYAYFHLNKKINRVHRFILNVNERNLLVDHKNHNGLDNGRNNLRVCTSSENNSNRVKIKACSSKYLGVTYEKKYNNFRVKLRHNKIDYHVGRFKDEIEAAKAYNDKAIFFHGEFANLNKF